MICKYGNPYYHRKVTTMNEVFYFAVIFIFGFLAGRIYENDKHT